MGDDIREPLHINNINGIMRVLWLNKVQTENRKPLEVFFEKMVLYTKPTLSFAL